jgi:hypothetical protein
MADTKHLLEFLGRGGGMFLGVNMGLLRVEFSPDVFSSFLGASVPACTTSR